MRATTKCSLVNPSSSQDFTFGPFAVGDVFESFQASFTYGGEETSGSGNISITAGAGSAKSDPDVKQSAAIQIAKSVPQVTCQVYPVWQKIESGSCYLTVSVSLDDGFVSPVMFTVGVSVRPAFKIPGFKSKLNSGMSLIQS